MTPDDPSRQLPTSKDVKCGDDLGTGYRKEPSRLPYLSLLAGRDNLSGPKRGYEASAALVRDGAAGGGPR